MLEVISPLNNMKKRHYFEVFCS